MIKRLGICLILLVLIASLIGVDFAFATVEPPFVTYGGIRYYVGDEVVPLRQENTKSFVTLSGSIRLEVHIGAIHYKDDYSNPAEQWKDIDLTWEGNYIGKAPFELWHDGNKLTLRDKKTGNITTIELDSIGGKHMPDVAWERSKGLARAPGITTIDNVALDTDLGIIAEFSAVRFRRVLKSDKAPWEAKFKITGDANFIRVRASDEDGDIPVESSLKDGILTETLKPDRAVKYPVKIDPTWQVGTSSDDAHHRLGNDFWSISTVVGPAGSDGGGSDQKGTGMRFANITIPQGSTIDTAKLTLRAFNSKSGTVVKTRVSAEDVNDAVTFADDAGAFDARWAGRTTARIDWDTIPAWTVDTDYDSPEIKLVIQEIISRGGWASGQAIVIFWEDFEDRSTHASGCFRTGYSYDGSTTYAPKLVIEYTPPPVEAPTVTTQAVSNIGTTTATGNGNITATGGENCDKRGIVYGTTSLGDPGAAAPPGGYDAHEEETDSFGTGAFTRALTGLTPGETYYARAYAHNSGGYNYGGEVSFTTLGPPSVTTNAADPIGETTATLKGEITSLNDGNATVRGFEWGTATGDYGPPWEGEGSFGVGEFDHDLTGLTKGELYYYRAYATGEHGTGYGEEVKFLTKPDEPDSLSAVVGGATQVDLTWSKGSRAQKTYIRGKDGSYPDDRDDGYPVYNDTGESCSDTGLDAGHVYYYRAWSYAIEGGEAQYSDLYDQDSVILSLGLELWFQPEAIISGVILLDRQGSYDGTIEWSGRFADSGTTTTLVDTELTQAEDYWKGYTVKIVEADSEAPEGEEGEISGFAAGTDTLTFAELTVAPGDGDRYEIWDGQKILWGSFPAGISVEVGALTSYVDPVSGAVGGESPEVAEVPQEPSGLWGGEASEDLPLYELFNRVATDLGWTTDVLYVFAWIIIAIGLGVALLITTGSVLAAVGGVGVGMAGGMATGMLPVWVLIVYLILGGTWLYTSRSM